MPDLSEKLSTTKLCFVATSIFHILLILPECMTMAVEVPFIPKQILIYGGNGFIGTKTAELLIEAGHKLTLVNRGNWYWDSAFTVKPFVQHIKCDRLHPIEKCPELQEYIYNVEKIDAVIDFSAYQVQALEKSLNLVHRKTKLYIYISTDSVYDVCIKNHEGLTLESDAIRPESEEMRASFQASENYGHRKLQCEEYLSQFNSEKCTLPYIILRLPDVIGPRDNTYRWWIYQLWMKLQPYLEQKIIVPSNFEKQPMSLVYVDDVAALLKKLVQNDYPNAYYQTFNLALNEKFSLKQFLEDMISELNITDVNITVVDNPNAIRLFPSVKSGPIDTTKAEQMLQWKPTKWSQVLRDTCSFYEQAIKLYYLDRPRNDVVKTMQTYLTSKPYDVLRGLRNVYGLAYPEPKDEL
ncbi:hypothetical protein Btru_014994 [Bulinus truncatus]|nr:hypothetical protein Btru_014994 [Bulinus truncatus]